jgi:hypothetical protein
MYKVKFSKDIKPIIGSSVYYNLQFETTLTVSPQIGMEVTVTIPQKGLGGSKLFTSGKIEQLYWDQDKEVFTCVVSPLLPKKHDTTSDIEQMCGYYKTCGWTVKGPYESGEKRYSFNCNLLLTK